MNTKLNFSKKTEDIFKLKNTIFGFLILIIILKMIFPSVTDTFRFMASGNLYEKMTILLLQSFCISCWNISKLTLSYSYRFLKYGYDHRGILHSFSKKKTSVKPKGKGLIFFYYNLFFYLTIIYI